MMRMMGFSSVFIGLVLASAAFCSTAQEPEGHQRVDVKEVVIGFNTLKTSYLDRTEIKSLPQVRVFAPDGTCLGVVELPTQDRGRLAERSNELIEKPQEDCNLLIDGDSSPEGGPGKYVGQLLVFEMDFCTACKDMEAELRGLAASDTGVDVWMLVKVSEDEALNPGLPGAGGE